MTTEPTDIESNVHNEIKRLEKREKKIKTDLGGVRRRLAMLRKLSKASAVAAPVAVAEPEVRA